MSRGYSVSPGVSWSRSKGNIEISASTDRSILSNPIGRAQGRSNKKGEEEEPARKRIRVACSRCRKRKIKCSGPVGGNDQPCQNCKNAGAMNSCAFELTGSVKLDFSALHFPSKGYLYGISDGLPGTTSYSNEHQACSLGSNILQYPTAVYSGALRPERDMHHSYAMTYNGNQDYYDYGQQASAYDSYSSYPTSSVMLQIPSQSHTADGGQDQFASWNQDLHANCNTYDDSVQSVSRTPLLLSVQRPLTSSFQYTGALISSVPSTASERVLPKPQQVLLPNSAPSINIVSDTRGQLNWPEDYESQTDSAASRRTSQDTSSGRSSPDQSSLIEQNINTRMESGVYPTLQPNISENSLSLATPLSNVQQHNSYVQQQAANKYQYHYSTLKPSPISTSTSATAIDAASIASIGNHAFTFLPFRTVDKCGDHQYQPHKGVLKAPSRIAVEIAGGGERRTDN